MQFDPGPPSWDDNNKEAVLLALDMVLVATNGTPEIIIDAILGDVGTRPLRFIPISGTAIGAGYASGTIQMYAAGLNSSYLSPGGLFILIHEMAHGIDESFDFTVNGGFNAVGWQQDSSGQWVYSGNIDYGSGNGPANNYLDGPSEDFASSFASVIFERTQGMNSINQADLSNLIRFTGDENGDGVVGSGETGYIGNSRRQIIVNEIFPRLRP